MTIQDLKHILTDKGEAHFDYHFLKEMSFIKSHMGIFPYDKPFGYALDKLIEALIHNGIEAVYDDRQRLLLCRIARTSTNSEERRVVLAFGQLAPLHYEDAEYYHLTYPIAVPYQIYKTSVVVKKSEGTILKEGDEFNLEGVQMVVVTATSNPFVTQKIPDSPTGNA
jgi:hypothetical protein